MDLNHDRDRRTSLSETVCELTTNSVHFIYVRSRVHVRRFWAMIMLLNQSTLSAPERPLAEIGIIVPSMSAEPCPD